MTTNRIHYPHKTEPQTYFQSS